MIHIDDILFASDFTPCSARALPLACDLAALTGARLHSVYARAGEDERFGPELNPVAYEQEVAGRLQEQVEQERVNDRWAARSPLRVQAAVVHGHGVAQALLDYARRETVDLVVMGTHGRRGLRRLVLGSVANEVVRRAPCPVLTVGGSERSYAGEIRSILVPVDFSVYARQALHHAKELAAFFGARVDLLHVLDMRIHPAFYNTGVFTVFDLLPDADRKAEVQLEHFYHETEGPVDAVRVVVTTGHAPVEIVEYARRAEIDLIVLSTHGLTGLEHLLIGSVAEKVVRTAPCPVLTVKAFGRSLVRAVRGDVIEDIDFTEG